MDIGRRMEGKNIESPSHFHQTGRDTRHAEDTQNATAEWLTLFFSDYIQIRQPVYLPHSAGRYAQKRFRKAQCPIIERLTNSLMMNGRNNGKKIMAVRIVAHAFEIVCPARRTTIDTSNTILTCYPTDPHHDRPEPHPDCR